MSEIREPEPTPVIDRRIQPTGALWRNAGKVAAGAAAVLMVGAMLLLGDRKPSREERIATAKPEKPQPLDAKVLAVYRSQLEAASDRADRTPPPPREMLMPPPQEVRSTGGGSSDPRDEERKARAKKDYDSLFSSSIVVSRRPGVMPAANTRQGATKAAPGAMPTVAETVSEILRQSGGVPSMSQSQGLPGVTPVNSPQPEPTATAADTTKRTPPIDGAGPIHLLLESTIIDAVLSNRLDGSSASPVKALVTNPVYSHNRRHVLIPAGAWVLGETKPVQNFGETRLAVSFDRLILPDGSTVSLNQFKGLNQQGDTGIHDLKNQHYMEMFGASAAIGIVNGLGQAVGNLGLGGGRNNTTVIAGGAANSTSQATNQIMNRFTNRLPTITIREGTRLKVYLTSDIELPAYPAQKGTTWARQ